MLFLGPRSSEIGRVIEDNDFGVVVEYPEDVATARRYLEFLRVDPRRAARVGERMRSFYRRCFGVGPALERFRRVLEMPARNVG